MKIYLQGKGFIKNSITETELEVEPGTLLGQLPAQLNFPLDQNLVYIVNGSKKSSDEKIRDGDRVILISKLTGG